MRKTTLYITIVLLFFAYGKVGTDLYAQTSHQEKKELVLLPKVHKGTLEIDTWLLDSNGQLPYSLRQFYLDARKVFAANLDADFTDEAIIGAAMKHDILLMGGPMLGDLTDKGVSIWLRPASTQKLTVKVKCFKSAKSTTYTGKATSAGEEVRIPINGLKPGKPYVYEVYAEEKLLSTGRFTTAPARDSKEVFRLTFGSCMHKKGIHHQRLTEAILQRKPAAMMLLGDIAVDDRENKVNMHRADYQLRDVAKPWRTLAANVPLYTSWDDHDYFNNDLNGIPMGKHKQFTAADRDAVRAVWHQNWNNPKTEKRHKGIYFNTPIGPVEIIMLDTRSCRDNARRGQYGSFLGQEQMTWLKKTLKNSKAPFIVLSSGTMWSDYVSDGKDSWGTWDKEAREEIFSFIEQEKINGVLLISGDRHGARGFRIPRSSDFSFYEFEPASLGGVSGGKFGTNGPPAIIENCPEQLFGYYGQDFFAFGEFTFDTSGIEAKVTFKLIDAQGSILETLEIPYNELTPE